MAIARPIPLDAPVTRAFLPVRSGPGTSGIGAPRGMKRAGLGWPAPGGRSGVGSIVVVVVRVGPPLGEAGLLQEGLREDVLVLAQDGLQRVPPVLGQVVLNGIFALGDGQLVAGPQRPLEDALAVDLQAVGAAEVADLPVARILEGQFAVQAGNVGEAEADVAGFAAADRQDSPPQRD